jgi:hypothetical protein
MALNGGNAKLAQAIAHSWIDFPLYLLTVEIKVAAVHPNASRSTAIL